MLFVNNKDLTLRPSTAKPRTKVRLKGICIVEDKKYGDLYLHVNVRG